MVEEEEGGDGGDCEESAAYSSPGDHFELLSMARGCLEIIMRKDRSPAGLERIPGFEYPSSGYDDQPGRVSFLWLTQRDALAVDLASMQVLFGGEGCVSFIGAPRV